ncbi:MAG: hypothetical protein DRP91_03700 [Candidatus Neomarinimicrobiota bacterium]|nr:MAG: hypothetical protein DRP91_03700 [Candidatus Neomarinimicrobiota bacterium]
MRGNGKEKIIFVLIMVIFGISIIFLGKSKTLPSGLVTVQLSDIDNEELITKINEALKNIEGIRPVFLDKKTSTYTLRYDSSIVKYDVIRSSFLNVGLKIEKVERLNKLTDQKSNSIFKIKITN